MIMVNVKTGTGSGFDEGQSILRDRRGGSGRSEVEERSGTGRTRLQLICCALATEPMVSDNFKGGRDRRRAKGSGSD